jgi:hypothetical protein
MMPEENRRFMVIQAFWQSRGELLAAIDGLSPEILEEPVLDGWSIKDHLAHVGHMDELRYFEVQRVINGLPVDWEPASAEQTDALNAIGVEARRHLTPDQVLKDIDLIRSLLLEAIQNAPEEALDGSHYGEFGLDGGAEHERSHAKTIQDWRKAQRL